VPVFLKADDLHLDGRVKLVDVREPGVYAAGHLRDAVNVPDLFTYLLSTSSDDDVQRMRSHFRRRFNELGIRQDEHVVVYEQTMDHQYGASCRGFFIFKLMNYGTVSTLEGGLDAFTRIQGNEQYLTQDVPTIVPCHFEDAHGHQLEWQMANREEVLGIVNDRPARTHLLDVRDAVEWNGLSSSPYGADFSPRKGRIPHSVWLEWYSFHRLDQEKRITELKSSDEVETMMKDRGIEKNDRIIIYCFKGSRASLVMMKLKEAHFSNVKNYVGSWNEWAADPELPIDATILHSTGDLS
jgi:thiosulfate/3-mercaptopyruvate sulfurtransferase